MIEAVFWIAFGLIAWSQVGYPLFLALLQAVLRRPSAPRPLTGDDVPFVTVVIPAYREASVIGRRIDNIRSLDWPADRLELIVACDGSDDGTQEAARSAGADLVLDLPRGGKIRAQDEAVRRARGDLIAFSDANAMWDPQALRALAAPFSEPGIAMVCGRVRFEGSGSNQEGIYWRIDMAIRGLESRLASITAGNGAIYAVRKSDYMEVDPAMDHDLMFPFSLVKAGCRAIETPRAVATELMTPTIETEFVRKRRMMSYIWLIVLRGGMLDPRGYGLLYSIMIFSHRVLRYASPILHLVMLVCSAILAVGSAFWLIVLIAQLAVLIAAAAASRIHSRPLLLCRYYVLMTASIASGLIDHLRHGTEAGWEPPEGTR